MVIIMLLATVAIRHHKEFCDNFVITRLALGPFGVHFCTLALHFCTFLLSYAVQFIRSVEYTLRSTWTLNGPTQAKKRSIKNSVDLSQPAYAFVSDERSNSP